MTIKFYKTNEPYGFLNNFKKAPMFIYGRLWKNVEAAYQAQKTLVSEEYDSIWNAPHPQTARDLGQTVTMRPDWDQIKVQVMHDCVYAKFSQNNDLKQQLLDTGDEELIEDSPIDAFWGCGPNGDGQNNLGKVLMQIRSELKNNLN